MTHGSRQTPQDLGFWRDALRRAEGGETVAVVADGKHLADVVPSGELARLHETIEVLSDGELVKEMQRGLEDLQAGRVEVSATIADDLRERRATSR